MMNEEFPRPATFAPTPFVIDDDDSGRKSPVRFLRSLGFGVETFASAEQGCSADLVFFAEKLGIRSSAA